MRPLRIQNWKGKLLFILFFFAIVAVYWFGGFSCPVRSFFAWLAPQWRVTCPGCGLTRALVYALQLDFVSALKMHAMIWSVPVLIIYWLFDFHIFKKEWIDNVILCLFGVGFLVNWIVHWVFFPV